MLLALDTATRHAGLALYDGDTVRAENVWHAAGHYHTEWLVPAISDAMQRAGVVATDLTGVAVTAGPGSFTGLRVAVSVAKGLAAAQNLAFVGVPTLQVTAYPHTHRTETLGTALVAGRGRHAYAFYPSGTSVAEGTAPVIGTVDAIVEAVRARQEPIYLVGEFTDTERATLIGVLGKQIVLASPALALRRPAVLAEIAWQRFQRGDTDNPHTFEPLYLQLTS